MNLTTIFRAAAGALLLTSISVAVAAPAPAANTTSPLDLVSTFTNPTDVRMADPFVLQEGDTYYLYGTSDRSRSNGFSVYTSRDLVRWNYAGECFTAGQPLSWGDVNFWAPEVVKQGSQYYLHYTAYSRKEGRRNILVAQADSPLGPFKDYSGPLFTELSVIDSHFYRDPNTGTWYAYAVPERYSPPGILVAEISPDFKHLTTSPTMCLKADMGWDDMWIEGPIITEHKGLFYMLYSGGAYWEGDYALGYATAKSPAGPWTKAPENPVLRRNDHVEGTGHNGLASSPDGSELFCVYHAHLADYTVNRVVALDRIRFVPSPDGGPDRLTMPGAPSWQPQPLPSGAAPFTRARGSEFSEALDAEAWHVFAAAPAEYKVADGALQVQMIDGDFWRTHDDGHNVFLQPVPEGDFAIETSATIPMQFINEQGFLTVWQDEDNHVTFAAALIQGQTFAITREAKGKADTSLTRNPLGSSLRLRLERRGDTLRFFAATADGKWQRAGQDVQLRGIEPRYIGLGAWAPGVDRKAAAIFDYFRVENL